MDAAAQARGRLGFLDAARGIAALMVVAAHGVNEYVPGYLPWARANLEVGRAGVVLFLIISGFIIPASLEQGGSLGKFWLRRLFRLFPAYWLGIAAAYACLLATPSFPVPVPRERTADWLINLTMCQRFLGRPDVSGVFWTLQLELVIYATCSLLFACGLLRRVGWWLGVVVVLAFVPVGLVQPLAIGKAHVLNDSKYLYLVPLMGLIAQRYWSGQVGWQRFYALVAGQPVVLAGVWLVSKILYPESVALISLRTWLLNWGLAYALFLGMLEARRLPMPSVALWLGRVSYSVYLFHPLVLALLLVFPVPIWAGLPILLAGTLAVSALTYYAVEEPGIHLGRAVERRLFAAKKAPVAEVRSAKAA
jgi:peptidoglycan/LPS O-acetylase OafA/YrhL